MFGYILYIIVYIYDPLNVLAMKPMVKTQKIKPTNALRSVKRMNLVIDSSA